MKTRFTGSSDGFAVRAPGGIEVRAREPALGRQVFVERPVEHVPEKDFVNTLPSSARGRKLTIGRKCSVVPGSVPGALELELLQLLAGRGLQKGGAQIGLGAGPGSQKVLGV